MTLSADHHSPIKTSELERVTPIVLAVIGPTNEGKTSVLRTLTGDPRFGEVNALTGTTARAEIQKVYYQSCAEILRLVDTPGFQMSGKILDLLEEHYPNDEKASLTVDSILAVIPETGDYRHDLRAWKAIDGSDILIYIVNAAESPNQSFQRDTLSLLSYAHKPLIAVFNNVLCGETAGDSWASPAGTGLPTFQYRTEWIEALRRRGFYLFQIYDAHRRDFENEYELLDKIAVLQSDPLTKKVLRAEMGDRLERERKRIDASRRTIARFMLDLASMREIYENVPKNESKQRTADLEERLNRRIQIREHAAHLELLSVWNFHPGILDRKNIALEKETTEEDHRFGDKMADDIKSGVKYGAGIGAAAGLLLDVALAGLSLGTGTTVGAAVGAAIGSCFGGLYNYHYDVKNERIILTPGKNVFHPLLARSVELVKKLSRRGKALEDGIQVNISKPSREIDVPETIAKLRELSQKTIKSPLREDERSGWIEDLSIDLKRILADPEIGR